MNLISIKIYSYINIILSVVYILLTLAFKNDNLQLIINIIPALIIGLSGYLINQKEKSQNLIKNGVLGVFVGSVLASFTPYIFQFNSNKSLLFVSLIFTILLLINIFVVKLDNEEKEPIK